MSIKIIFGDYVFEDASNDLMEVSGATYQSMLSTILSADDFSFVARYNPGRLGYYITDSTEGSDYLRTSDGQIVNVTSSNTDISDFENFTYAEPAELYDDDTLVYKFYVTNVAPIAREQDGTIHFEFTCVSFVGLTINMEHKGGMYSNSTFGAVMADILDATLTTTTSTSKTYTCSNGLTYSVDTDVDSSRIDGHLPIATCRDNIRDVLEQCGASILKNANGTVRFTYNIADTPIGIAAEKIYIGDKYSEAERVTDVLVVEHNFYKISGTELETLYDGTAEVLDHTVVLFDDPCYDMDQSPDVISGDLVINASNCNYADISGTGTLQGKKYAHSQRQLTQTTGLTSAENIRQIEDNELASPLNSANLLERLRNYYSNAKEVDMDFVVENGVKTGSLVSFSDPLNRTKTGYVSEMQFNVTGIVKSASKIITNWSPSGIGPNYSQSETLTGSGTYTVPSGCTKMRVVMIQGGTGGNGGYAGTSPNTSAYSSGNGGAGGAAGEGGSAGKVYQVDLTVTPGSTFAYSVGSGGAGGAINHGTGSAGGVTTFGSYSSASGSIPSAGFVNIITGALYATSGSNGYAGGKGGGSDGDAENVTVGSTTYNGGGNGSGTYYQGNVSYYIGGGGGGGAAYGAAGSNGTDAYVEYGSITYPHPGNGGAGASAALASNSPSYGAGGIGGNGGGGGGIGGYHGYWGEYVYSQSGAGGNGSVGGSGGSGVIFIIR